MLYIREHMHNTINLCTEAVLRRNDILVTLSAVQRQTSSTPPSQPTLLPIAHNLVIV